MFKRIILMLAFAILLVACGGAEPTATPVPPTNTPAPTATTAPTNTPEPTATPDVTADFVELENEAIGLTISHPEGWAVEVNEEQGNINLASDPQLIEDSDNVEEGAMVTLGNFPVALLALSDETLDTTDPVAVLNVLSTFFMAPDEGEDSKMEITSEAAATEISGYPAATMDIAGESDSGIMLNVHLVVILQEDKRAVVFASAIAEPSVEELKPVTEAMLASLVVGEAPDMGEMPVEPEVGTGTGTNAGAAALPEPTAVDLAPGDYIYTNPNVVRDTIIFNGELWAASLGGLVRYTLGTEDYRLYTPADGLPDIGTFSLAVCPLNGEDRLFVGTRKGIIVYNATDDSWETGDTFGFAEEESIHLMTCDSANGRLIFDYADISVLDLATGELTSYEEDADGLAWFSFDKLSVTEDGVWATTNYEGASFIANDGTVTLYDEATGNIPDNDVVDVEEGPDGTLWIGASDGLYNINADGTVIAEFTRDNTEEISYFGPDSLEFAPDGTLWLAFSSDVCQFDTAAGSCLQLFSTYDGDNGLPYQASIGDLKLDENGNPYIYTYDDGVAHFNGTSWTTYAAPVLAPDNFVDNIEQTSDGTIWVFSGSGIFRTDVNASTWERLDGVYGIDMLETADGNIWFISGRTLYQYTGQQIFEYGVEAGMLDTYHNALAVSSDGLIYIGGDEGYTVFNPADNTFVTIGVENGWDSEIGYIYDVLATADTVYAATSSGLLSLTPEGYEVLVDETFVDLPSPYIYKLGEWVDGTIVLGTSSGIAYYDGESVRPDPNVTGSVEDIYVLPTGEMYVTAWASNSFFGTGGDDNGGLYYYDGVETWSYRSVDEMLMDSARSVLVDNAGTVWVGQGDSGLGGGILRIVP